MNKHFFKNLFCIFSLFSMLLANSLFAQPVIDKQSKAELQAKLASLEPFQSAYQQSVFDKNEKQVEEAKGSFYLGTNKAFKNIIESPEHSAMISNGEKLWMIDYELDQVSVSYLKDYLAGSPIALLLEGSGKSLDSFNVIKMLSANSKNSSYRLIALDPLASITEVRIGFINNKITSIDIEEKSGNKVKITFSKIVSLKNPQKAFLAKIPKGFDVVNETLAD
jgi:outer membrane lipoprotein carrier protein